MTILKSVAISGALGACAGAAFAAQVPAQGTIVSIENSKFAPGAISAAAHAPITFVN